MGIIIASLLFLSETRHGQPVVAAAPLYLKPVKQPQRRMTNPTPASSSSRNIKRLK
jgi:hypothetical protein